MGEKQPESVLKELRERDRRDRTRAASPLAPAADAVVIDSTDMRIEEVVARAEEIIRKKIGRAGERESVGSPESPELP